MAAWCLLGLDPVGIEEGTAALAEQTAMRISSALYPAFDQDKDLVTVILLDQDYLKLTKSTWPLPYAEQGELLQRILQLKPAAIFIDLLYKNPHADPSDSPRDLLSSVQNPTEIPIYLSGLTSLPEGEKYCANTRIPPDGKSLLDEKSVLAEIRETAGKHRIALVEWERCKDLYPLYLAGRPADMTPAYALFREYTCRQKLDACPDNGSHIHSYLQAMKVLWGAFPPSDQTPFYAQGACQYDTIPEGRLSRTLRRAGVILNQLMFAALGASHAERNVNDALPCPAVNVIPATALLAAEASKDPGLERLFHGRLVLIGAQIPGIPDITVSPVHGQLPAVVLHAMALDNLLRFESGYVRETPEWFVRYVLPAFVLIGVALLVYVFPIWRHRTAWSIVGLVFWGMVAAFSWIKGDPGKSMLAIGGGLMLFLIAPTAAARALIAFLIVVLLGAVAPVALGWSPMNWLIVAIAAVLVSEKVYDDEHGEDERQYVLERLDRIFLAWRPSKAPTPKEK